MDRAALDTVCKQLFGNPPTSFKRLTGGASMESWAMSVGAEDYVLRRAPGGANHGTGLGGVSLETEAQLIRSAKIFGVTVPDIAYILTPDDGLGTGYIMARLPGEALPPRLFKDETLAHVWPDLPKRLAQEMATIHAIPLSALPDDVPHKGATELIADYKSIYDQLGEHRPIYELAFEWLQSNCPVPADPVLVHGDFRLGNLLIDSSGLTGVLDWEIAHTGDRHQDLAYICAPSWRFGRYDAPVGGIGQIAPFLAAYEAAAGVSVDQHRFEFWRMLTTVFWGTACMALLQDWRDGTERSLERAAIGRRISEVEIDILILLEELGARSGKTLSCPPLDTHDKHGPTHRSELSMALSEWIGDDIAPTAKGRDLFQARVAMNVLGILARQSAMGPDYSKRRKSREANLSDPFDWDHLRLCAMEQLEIDNPRYAGLKKAKEIWT